MTKRIQGFINIHRQELMGIRKELLELCTETAQKFLVGDAMETSPG